MAVPIEDLNIAVGGNQIVFPKCWNGGHQELLLDLPYKVYDEGDRLVRAEVLPSGKSTKIQLSGVAPGHGEIRLIGDYVDERVPIRTAIPESIELEPIREELADEQPWVWISGHHAFKLVVLGGGLDLMGMPPSATCNGTPLDLGTIEVNAPGTYSMKARAGDLEVDVPFTVVDRADVIALHDPDIKLTRFTSVCFGAFTTDGRRLIGVEWTITVENNMPKTGMHNCAYVKTTPDQVGQSIRITASAAGLSRTVSLPVN